MAGHSHWAKIKRAKGANDVKRGKIWSKIARKIIIAAKAGGGDPNDNLSLRYTIDEAKAANMPRDTIEKAVKKGTGELGAENYEPALYEGYAPGGAQPSFDKQFVRDYLERIHWNKQAPAPALPDDVVSKTREKYLEAYQMLTGNSELDS